MSTTTRHRAGSSGQATPAAPPARTARQSQRWLAWVFLAPTILGMGLFTLIPIAASVVLAFFRWDIISAPSFVGFDNFAEVVQDPTVRVSFLNTIMFVVVAVALQMGLALALAIWCRKRCPPGCGCSSAPPSSSR